MNAKRWLTSRSRVSSNIPTYQLNSCDGQTATFRVCRCPVSRHVAWRPTGHILLNVGLLATKPDKSIA